MSRRPNLRNIRQLLVYGLSENELRTIYYDDPKFEQFFREELSTSSSLGEIADRLIEYTVRRDLIENLLTIAKKCNPAKYAEYESYYEDALFDVTGPSSPSSVERVCIISSEYPPHEGGLAPYVEKLTTALGNYNIKVDVILPTINPNDEYDNPPEGVNLHPIWGVGPSYYNDDKLLLHFAHLAVEKFEELVPRPQIIHCHDWVTVLAGVSCQRKFNIPLVFHVHLPTHDKLNLLVENLGLACADLVMVHSQYTKRQFKSFRKVVTKLPIKVVNKSVDLETFRPCDDRLAEGDYILFVGRLKEMEQNQVGNLFMNLLLALSRFPDLSLKMVDDGAHRPQLKQYPPKINNVEFPDELPNWKQEKTMIELFQKARIVVVPPGSVVEALQAMACGRPVVARDHGKLEGYELDGYVKHNVTGLLVVNDSWTELAVTIAELLEDPERRRRLGEAGRAQVEKPIYNWNTIIKQICDHYGSLLKSPLNRADTTDIDGHIQKIKKYYDKLPEDDEAQGWLDDLFKLPSNS